MTAASMSRTSPAIRGWTSCSRSRTSAASSGPPGDRPRRRLDRHVGDLARRDACRRGADRVVPSACEATRGRGTGSGRDRWANHDSHAPTLHMYPRASPPRGSCRRSSPAVEPECVLGRIEVEPDRPHVAVVRDVHGERLAVPGTEVRAVLADPLRSVTAEDHRPRLAPVAAPTAQMTLGEARPRRRGRCYPRGSGRPAAPTRSRSSAGTACVALRSRTRSRPRTRSRRTPREPRRRSEVANVCRAVVMSLSLPRAED